MISRRAVMAFPFAAALPSRGAPAAFTDPRAVFVSPHPDDETLTMAGPIAHHVAAGRVVHVVALTKGGASSARAVLNGTRTSPWWGLTHDPGQEGYDPLSVREFETARVSEFRAACSALGVRRENVHVYDLPDGAVTAAAVRSVLRADFAWPGASYKSLSYRWDNHPDHRAAGEALRQLQAEQPAVWGDSRWYVYRPYWGQADPSPATRFELPTAVSQQRVRNACRAYSGWAPVVGHYAVGYHSIAAHFLPLEQSAKAMVQLS
jgi:LmbE family N-acetylglucosaminyl deacetylase